MLAHHSLFLLFIIFVGLLCNGLWLFFASPWVRVDIWEVMFLLLGQEVVNAEHLWLSPVLVVTELGGFLHSILVVLCLLLEILLAFLDVLFDLMTVGVSCEGLAQWLAGAACLLAKVLEKVIHLSLSVSIWIDVFLTITVLVTISVGGLLVLSQLGLPDLVDLLNLVLAEAEPARDLSSLLGHLLGHLLLIIVTVHVVQLLLCEVLQFKGDLSDLSHGHARRDLSRWEVELGITLKGGPDKLLQGHQVSLIKQLLQVVENDEALLVRDGAELIVLDQVDVGLNDLASEHL